MSTRSAFDLVHDMTLSTVAFGALVVLVVVALVRGSGRERPGRPPETVLADRLARGEIDGLLDRQSAVVRSDQRVGRSGVRSGPRRPVPDPAVTAGVGPDRLERILAPLLDSAVRYAVAELVPTAEARPDGVRVLVRDDFRSSGAWPAGWAVTRAGRP
ncbi:hypothetical protein [Cryptosporangium japonicum]